MSEIILDTETTGLNSGGQDRIVEIYAVEFKNKNINREKEFHIYVNPEIKVSSHAQMVHGLDDKFLLDKPKFSEIADSLVNFIGESDVIAHNASFDMEFLNKELRLCRKNQFSKDRFICTLKMARELFPRGDNSLTGLCKRYKIDVSSREKHSAKEDVMLLARVYQNMYFNKQLSMISFLGEPKPKKNTLGNGNYEMPSPRNFVSKLTEEEEIQHKEFLASVTNPIWDNYD